MAQQSKSNNHQSKSHNTHQKLKNKNQQEVSKVKDLLLIPIMFAIMVIPFIVRYKLYNPKMSQYPWFGPFESQQDFFLYYKQLSIIGVAVLMLVIIGYKLYKEKRNIQFTPVFVPLIAYVVLAFASSIFSEYSYFCFNGSFEQFESFFVLFGYCIICYYCFLIMKDTRETRNIVLTIIIATIAMSLLGLTQFLGHDFLATKLGLSFILPERLREGASVTLNFGEGRVYLSLYNPNYVGVYASIFIPILLVIALYSKKIVTILASIIAIIGLSMCIIGSGSLSGVFGIGIALVGVLVFAWRDLFKKMIIILPIMIILLILVIVINKTAVINIKDKIQSALQTVHSQNAETELVTNDNNVEITYQGNKLFVEYITNDDQTATILSYDENLQQVASQFNQENQVIYITDERFKEISIGFGEYAGTFYVNLEGRRFDFTNYTEDGTYYYINYKGIIDKIVTAPSAVFTGYETFASYRGYIWSRTIPLLKKYIFLGSGPDTYTLVYPQNDYYNMMKYGFGDAVMTKPHSMYLQMGVQTGVLSLIAFLVFYLMYFVMSIRVYITSRINSPDAVLGLAIFLGTVSYMVAGIANDSFVGTAPVFWALIGIGIAMNYRVRALAREEIKTDK